MQENTVRKPPKAPARGCVKVTIEGKREAVDDFIDGLEKTWGLRYQSEIKDSGFHEGLKYARVEVTVQQ